MTDACSRNKPGHRRIISDMLSYGDIDKDDAIKMLSLLEKFPESFYIESQYSGMKGMKNRIIYGVMEVIFAKQ